ncbi:MAG TPA: sigma-54 dependent transcriptional regulator [Kofleriaceae bacterium]|nr:sigma-54 dependent transcriptional regulator [Kofleriaceae bacterium]
MGERESLAILIAEDDEALRELVVEVLEKRGYRVDRAADGGQALRAVQSRHYDVVISDVHMPQVDGFTLLEHLRRTTAATDVIIITGHGTIPEAIAATRASALYLTKPFGYEDLLGALAKIAERRRVETELAAADTPLVGDCAGIVQIKHDVQVIGKSDGAVVINGESGTGKELVARMIHEASGRRGKPLITVNCAAFPDTLLEAELFGHERGAFTGATNRREGRFEAANGGTLFLDEIAEMPLMAQAKLLRVLEQGTFQRLGSNTNISVDVRIISATNKDLEELVAEGKFREDLFYRIKLFRVQVPPLRERGDDLVTLVEHFCRKYAQPGARPTLSPAAWAVLREHSFPGNVRELEHAIRHAMAFAGGEEIQVAHLPHEIAGDARAQLPAAVDGPAPGKVLPLVSAITQFEHAYLLQALEITSGNRSQAAQMLGISRKSLWAKLKRYRSGSRSSVAGS